MTFELFPRGSCYALTTAHRDIAANFKLDIGGACDATQTNDILASTYGNKAPDAAKFGKGVSDIAGAKQATDARREIKPGSYDHKR